jgi:predicted DNA binding CopG/RHH family protein
MYALNVNENTRKGYTERRKQRFINVRFDDGDFERVGAAARQDGLKKGAFVRRVVLLHLRSGNGKERS